MSSLAKHAELKLTNETLVEAKVELTRANRAKSDFLAAMTHEIRTPMNGILGMCEILGATPLAPGQREMVGTLQKCGKLLLSVINDILDFSKVEAGQMLLEGQPFDLPQAIEDCFSMLRSTLARREIDFRWQADPRGADAHPGRCGQISADSAQSPFNALKFTEKGRVELRVSVVPGEVESLLILPSRTPGLALARIIAIASL